METIKLTGAVGGFPEFLPAQQRAADEIISIIKTQYESYGYTPLETATVEKIETLLAKGIAAKEVYGLRRLNAEDGEGDKELALRFDLTVPLARYVVQNQNELVFPFRRYQIQPVFRGERPQKGRYRQFHQADIDILGQETLPLSADAEVIACATQTLAAILPKGEEFILRINNRKLLQGLVAWAGSADIPAAIKTIDNAEKVGWPKTIEGLIQTAIAAPKAEDLAALLQASNLENLTKLGLSGEAEEGLTELQTVLSLAKTLLPPALHGNLKADLTIARGLDYYTGTVVETVVASAKELGSVCSGGRYENLTASLGKKAIPGVGLSIGLSRLLAWLLTQEPWASMPATPATVLVTCQDENLMAYYAKVAQTLRQAGIKTELHPGGQALGTQIKNGVKRGLTFAIMANDDDAKANRVQLKNLATATQSEQALETLPTALL